MIRRDLPLHLTAAGAFVITAGIRFFEIAGFPNDHFLYIAAGQQMTFGDLPSRDFVDPGAPLMYAASAAAQLTVGHPLLGEALLVSIMFGLAAAFTVYGAFQVSGSLPIAALATAIEVALFPRTYHYPKIVVFAAGMLAIWRYILTPSLRRATVLAAIVVVAFLFRHDLGVYLGAAGAVAAAGARGGWREAALRTAQYAALVGVFAAPYIAFVAMTAGLGAYVRSGLAYSSAEAGRTGTSLQAFDVHAIASAGNARSLLFYTIHILPVVALAIVSKRVAKDPSDDARMEAAYLLPLAMLALGVNVALLRDPLQARLADVAVPACLLAAWLIARAWRQNGRWRVPARALVVAWLAIALPAVNVIGTPLEQLDRAHLLSSPKVWPAIVREQLSELQGSRHPTQLGTRTARGLAPFLEYVDRCTTSGDRLFVAGEAPEIFVATRRPFAGGQHVLRAGYFSTLEDQQRIVRRLRLERVPLALILKGSDAESVFTRVMQELDASFVRLTEIRAHDAQIVEVRVRGDMRLRGTDAETGLPCFR